MASTTPKLKRTSRKNVEAAPTIAEPPLALVAHEPPVPRAASPVEPSVPIGETVAANDAGTTIMDQFVTTCARVRELSNVLLRGEHTFVAKLLYEKMYPQARQGGARAKRSARSEQTATIASFADAIAAETRRSARAVRLDIEIVSSLGADVASSLRDTPIASQTTVLHAIAALPEKLQAEVTTSYILARTADGDVAADRILKTALSATRPPRTPRTPVAQLLDRVRLRVPVGEARQVEYAGRTLRIAVTSVTGDKVRVAVEIVEGESTGA
jgi:hypothetical protein